jgi:hypothetical protein
VKLKLIVIGGKKAGMEIPIPMPKCFIGRGDDCHIRPQSQLVSRRHCVISATDDSATIEDCGSANGTLVNGKPLRQRHTLKNGDWITVGTLDFEFRKVANEATTTAAWTGTSYPSGGNGKDQGNDANLAENGTLPGKLQSQTSTKKPPAANVQTAAGRMTIVPAIDGEADLLGWLDGKSNGRSDAQSPPKSGVYEIAAGDLLNDSFAASVSQQGHQNKGITPRRVVARALPASSKLASQERTVAVSLEAGREAREWNGIDLLLMAALGMTLVVVLSWLFPMSWPETSRGPREWLRWFLWNWWHIWWLRWGTVAILVAALMKLLCLRARSEQGG